jgi:enterochelin esterase-like enzyme
MGQLYPVLYINDGQDREALRLRETLVRLTQAGRIRPIVAVAIPANEDRLHEYGTAVALNAQGLGTRAAAYSNFVMEEVRPLIEGRFRVRREAFFLGASLGGLSAFDIAWNHPKSFDGVGVFSGSFWWRAATDETRIDPGERIAHAIVRSSEYRPGFRSWFQTGTRDEVSDRDGNGVIDAIQDTRELIDELTRLGYEEGRDVAYVEVPGGRHDWETWAGALPDFLIWAFGPTPTTRPGLPAAQPSSAPGRHR